MKLTIDRDLLADALATCAEVTTARTTRPILEYVLLRSVGARTEVLATDLAQALRVEVARADASGPGAFLLPLKRTLGLVRSFEGARLTLEPGKGATFDVKISDGSSRFTLPGWDPRNFPDLEHLVDVKTETTLPAAALRRGLDLVAFAVSREMDPHYALRSVLVERRAGTLTLAATDGKRLALFTHGDKVEGDDLRRVVPAEALHALRMRLAAGEVATVGLRLQDATTTLVAGAATLAAQNLKLPFPPTDGVLPGPEGYASVKAPVPALAAAVRRALLVLDGKTTTGVSLRLDDGALEVSAEGRDLGSGTSNVAVPYDGDERRITINGRWLLEGLEAPGEAAVELRVKDANSPLELTVPGWRYLVMPIMPIFGEYAPDPAARVREAIKEGTSA